MSSSKQYGLIVAEKSKTQPTGFQATRNVFGDDSDSEDDAKKPVLRPSHNINRQAKISQEKAIMEDPTVYQYDEIYDTMSSQKEEKKIKIKEEKKPRYIENLLKSANKRKIENERRMERKIQLEREKEGDEFADKEVFVTSAYKKKLEELRQEEEREKREEYLESIGDVTKQSDLGGFYRHLYEQKLGPEELSKVEQKSPEEENTNKDNTATFKTKKDESSKNTETKRNYRKRQANKKDLSEGEIEESEEEINRLNLEDIRAKKFKQNEENIDADSDFSIDSSSSDDDESKKKDKKKDKRSSKTEEVTKLPEEKDVKVSETANDKNQPNKDMNKENTPATPPPEPKPKIDIWKKRTVGDALDEALKRYYERKAARGL